MVKKPPPYVAGLTHMPFDGQDKNMLFKSSESCINNYDPKAVELF
jgi:hypothetical protein